MLHAVTKDTQLRIALTSIYNIVTPQLLKALKELQTAGRTFMNAAFPRNRRTTMPEIFDTFGPGRAEAHAAQLVKSQYGNNRQVTDGYLSDRRTPDRQPRPQARYMRSNSRDHGSSYSRDSSRPVSRNDRCGRDSRHGNTRRSMSPGPAPQYSKCNVRYMGSVCPIPQVQDMNFLILKQGKSWSEIDEQRVPDLDGKLLDEYDFSHLEGVGKLLGKTNEEVDAVKDKFLQARYDPRHTKFIRNDQVILQPKEDAGPSRSIYFTKDPLLKKVDIKKINELHRQGKAEAENRFSRYVSSVKAVRKDPRVEPKNLKDYAITINYIEVNKQMVRVAYQLP
ncbi:hypothetical protein SARC_09161 [Sphaeroforma arctica JP610]|uniref:Uncharacterized protein n=1 Tax=Sphaeroforma arctica JP610 TaxID=667725 RepID=A0A0L0FNL0_9EUKA|nr:hypothetical protein SARC_09161 [Sphaeroforma arctica JP610]KNC78402.1 hypothetical protein SARC_09161 [Sphaeroforma arctica JP610]|eukprot:XP_014152304.1 hypothetical protein SARC_09161 [Sphaeroforma arctica JP610]